MYLFISSIFPLALIAWFILKKNKNFIPLLFAGSLCAVLICAYRTFFLISHTITVFSPKQNFLTILMHHTILPVAILYGLFLLISKDKLVYKLEAFFPLMVSFYMIYMPYFVIADHKTSFSFFELFIIPLLFLFMIFTVSELLLQIHKSIKNRKFILTAVFVLAALSYLVIPSVLEILFTFNINTLLLYIIFIVYIAVSIFFAILNAIRTGSLK